MAVSTRPKVEPKLPAAQRRLMRSALSAVLIALVVIPLASSALGLYDRVTHWGKLVHGVECFLMALLVGLLILGWRDRESIDLTNQLAALLTLFAGVLFGVLWELIEFVIDWVRYSDIQKSNTDTTTDLLWSDVGAVIGAVLAVRLYCRWLRARDRDDLGDIAVWLLDGPSRFLDRRGFLMMILVAVLAGAAVAALWFAGRPVPGFPIG
jgi:hypothetical protein